MIIIIKNFHFKLMASDSRDKRILRLKIKNKALYTIKNVWYV